MTPKAAPQNKALSASIAICARGTDEGLCVRPGLICKLLWFVYKHQTNISIALNMVLFALITYKFESGIKCVIGCDEAGG